MEPDRLHDERVLVAAAMIRWGGSFVAALGEALAHADPHNAQLIKTTWPEQWAKYQGMALEAKAIEEAYVESKIAAERKASNVD